MDKTEPTKKSEVTSGAREGQQLMFLISHQSCYSYIQPSPVTDIHMSANFHSLVLAFQYNVVEFNSYMDPHLLSVMIQSYKCFPTGKMSPSQNKDDM